MSEPREPDLSQDEKVICDIPVYLSKSLAKQLYIVQYPQRPATVAMDKSEVLEAKIKAGLDKLQLTLGVETDSDYYDEFHGEILAEAAEGLGLNDNEYIPDTRKKIDKTIMESNCPPKLTNPARYMAAIIKDGAVHLTPLKAIVQMKPTLPFLNQADKARAKLEGGDADDDDEEATKVTIKFKRNPVDPNKASMNKSSFSARKREEEEPWTVLNYEDYNDEVFDKLCTANVHNPEPMYVLTKDAFLKKLFPMHVEAVIDGSDKSSKGPTMPIKVNVQAMRSMPLPEQLKALILNGKVLRYSQVVDFFRTRLKISPDDTTLLRTLQTVAVLVQGCWVARSEIVYPDNFKSNANGVSGPIMQVARDTVLSYFNEHRFVERRKLAPMLHIPTEELTEILTDVATRVVKKGWEFRLPFDHSFVNKYQEITQRQNRVWEMKNHHRNRKMSESSKEKEGLKPPRSPPRRRHSRTMSYSSDNDNSETESRARRSSGGASAGGRQRRPSSRSTSESSLLGVSS